MHGQTRTCSCYDAWVTGPEVRVTPRFRGAKALVLEASMCLWSFHAFDALLRPKSARHIGHNIDPMTLVSQRH